MPTSHDVFDRVAALAPNARSLTDAEWPADDRRRLLADITGPTDPADVPASVVVLPLPPTPYQAKPARHRWAPPVAAAIATLTATAGILLAVRGTGTGSSSGASGPGVASPGRAPALATPFTPPRGLSNKIPGGGPYYYHVNRVIALDAQGKALPNGPDTEFDRNWIRVDGDGDLISVRTGTQNGCERFPRLAVNDPLGYPTRALFASLPTDVTELTAYLRLHTDGASSRDEAVFWEIGDSLSLYGGLASPRLRAAMLAVLSRTPGVRVFLGQKDYLGRPAIRADFVDQRLRPSEVDSYYFDPTNFRFLEHRTSRNSQPTTYNGPSPAYTAAAPSNADDPRQLRRTLGVDVVVEERMVRTLPAEAMHCSGSLIERRSTPIPATPS